MERSQPNQKKFKSQSNYSQEFQENLGKLQPQALELEESVLGALMLEKDALSLVIDILDTESFYHEKHQRVYNAIKALFSKSEPIDIRTVANQLRSTGELELVGGAFFITQLTNKVHSAGNIEYHARIIAQYAIKRQLIKIGAEIQKDAYEDTNDVFDLLDSTEQRLFEISESNIKRNFSSLTDILGQAMQELEERRNHEDGLTGVPSGFTKLDNLTSGWQMSDLIIIAARPAMGKTAFILSMLRNASVDHERPVAIFSLEMSSVQMVNRLISAEAEIEAEKIKKGNLQEHEYIQMHNKIGRLTNASIFIDDTPAISVLELRAKCRRLKSQHDIQLVVIDYLQLMTGENQGNKNAGNREQEIAQISRALKNLAKELNVPVIALSQLSRAVELRTDKRPQLSDLRESGSIEQDADMVLFLYRPEYYGLTEDMEGNPTTGTAEIILAKHRNGPVDTVTLRYVNKFTKFQDLEANQPADFSFPDVESEDFGQNEIRMQSRMNQPPGNETYDLGKYSDHQEGSDADSQDDEEPPF